MFQSTFLSEFLETLNSYSGKPLSELEEGILDKHLHAKLRPYQKAPLLMNFKQSKLAGCWPMTWAWVRHSNHRATFTCKYTEKKTQTSLLIVFVVARQLGIELNKFAPSLRYYIVITLTIRSQPREWHLVTKYRPGVYELRHGPAASNSKHTLGTTHY